MAVGCGPNLAKIFLIIFNVIFWLSGAALLGVGIWLLVDPSVSSYLDILNAVEGSSELLKYAAYVLIAVGGFVLIVGFFGCCGAIKESRVMLGIYIVLLVLIMGLEIAAGVLAILYKDKIIDSVSSELDNVFTKYYGNAADANDTSKAFTQGMNLFQREFKCCGVNGVDDYSKVTADIGCVDSLKSWINKHATILIGVGIGIACLELFGFIFAVCLCRNVGEEE